MTGHHLRAILLIIDVVALDLQRLSVKQTPDNYCRKIRQRFSPFPLVCVPSPNCSFQPSCRVEHRELWPKLEYEESFEQCELDHSRKGQRFGWVVLDLQLELWHPIHKRVSQSYQMKSQEK
jgi:hypothetical protein